MWFFSGNRRRLAHFLATLAVSNSGWSIFFVALVPFVLSMWLGSGTRQRLTQGFGTLVPFMLSMWLGSGTWQWLAHSLDAIVPIMLSMWLCSGLKQFLVALALQWYTAVAGAASWQHSCPSCSPCGFAVANVWYRCSEIVVHDFSVRLVVCRLVVTLGR